MNTQELYLIVVNDQPFFAASCPENLSALLDEAKRRFGSKAKVDLFKQTTVPFSIHAAKVGADNDK